MRWRRWGLGGFASESLGAVALRLKALKHENSAPGPCFTSPATVGGGCPAVIEPQSSETRARCFPHLLTGTGCKVVPTCCPSPS